MLDVADALYDAACSSGLTDALGDDGVQMVMAAAFATASAEADR
jgi:hypothetical protein